MRFHCFHIAALFAASGFLQAQPRNGEGPWRVDLGSLKIRPYGFLDLIETTRSATVNPSVSTALGNAPLTETPYQNLTSARHSRLMTMSELPLGGATFRTYLESDFMTVTPGQSPLRWRQYYSQMNIGKWEVLGGKAWSLLRPNRRGIASDRDVMNTDVLEPAYHVGLMGARRRQIRLTRHFGRNYTAAVAWEGVGNTVAKVVKDGAKFHWELQALSGTQGRRGAGVAGTYNVTRRVRLVAQEFWSRHAISEALGVVPAGTDGWSSLGGVETQVRPNLEVYAYFGGVHASRSAGNHAVGQWSAGLNRTLTPPVIRTQIRLSIEFSHLDRVTWANRTGQMNYLMAGLRYSVN